jgi:transposase
MIKYHVTLTESERKYLRELVAKGKTQGYRIRHAQIMLALDEIPENTDWTDKKIAKAYQSSERSVGELRKRFVEEGFEAALGRKKRETPPVAPKITGEVEAQIVALACSEPPEGRTCWTLRLLADRVVELGILESVSHNAIGETLKKTSCSPGGSKNGASGNQAPNT